MAKTETNKAVPNYEVECEVCGQVPTVRIVDENDKLISDMELCGPCCWGEADTIDPENW